MFLLRSTLVIHILQLHFDEAFIVDSLKRNFAKPRIVIDNPGARSENAIYDLPCGGKPCLLVAIKYKPWPSKNLIVTFHAIPEDQVRAKIKNARVLWPKQ